MVQVNQFEIICVTNRISQVNNMKVNYGIFNSTIDCTKQDIAELQKRGINTAEEFRYFSVFFVNNFLFSDAVVVALDKSATRIENNVDRLKDKFGIFTDALTLVAERMRGFTEFLGSLMITCEEQVSGSIARYVCDFPEWAGEKLFDPTDKKLEKTVAAFKKQFDIDIKTKAQSSYKVLY